MFGYLIVIVTVILLIFTLYRRKDQFSIRPPEEEGYYLLVRKFEQAGIYYGIFQQGEKELTLEIPANLYVRLQEPVRGYLRVVEGKVQQFD